MNTKWNVISVYSRKEAIADGLQVPANIKTWHEAGIRFPVFFTRAVYDKYVKVPVGYEGLQDEDGRLWDIFTMFKHYNKMLKPEGSTLEFLVAVSLPDLGDWLPNEKRGSSNTMRLVTLLSVIGPLDFDNPKPAITIMIPGED
jgi:hypothetical protein